MYKFILLIFPCILLTDINVTGNPIDDLDESPEARQFDGSNDVIYANDGIYVRGPDGKYTYTMRTDSVFEEPDQNFLDSLNHPQDEEQETQITADANRRVWDGPTYTFSNDDIPIY